MATHSKSDGSDRECEPRPETETEAVFTRGLFTFQTQEASSSEGNHRESEGDATELGPWLKGAVDSAVHEAFNRVMTQVVVGLQVCGKEAFRENQDALQDLTDAMVAMHKRLETVEKILKARLDEERDADSWWRSGGDEEDDGGADPA